MKQFQAIIFDMDGVIIDSEPRHERAFMEVFREIGYADTHGVRFSDYFGKSDRTLWLDFIAKHQPPHTLEDLLNRKQQRVIKMLREEQPIYETLPELIAHLSRQYTLAVASGSFHNIIDVVLEMKGLRPFFGAVVSSQDVKRGKPAPDIFLRTAELLKVTPQACCVIEDSAAGVEGALAAGMKVIAITNSLPREKLSRATHVVDRYEEIERLLLKPSRE